MCEMQYLVLNSDPVFSELWFLYSFNLTGYRNEKSGLVTAQMFTLKKGGSVYSCVYEII